MKILHVIKVITDYLLILGHCSVVNKSVVVEEKTTGYVKSDKHIDAKKETMRNLKKIFFLHL